MAYILIPVFFALAFLCLVATVKLSYEVAEEFLGLWSDWLVPVASTLTILFLGLEISAIIFVKETFFPLG